MDRFARAASVLAVVGAAVAGAGPLVPPASPAFRGSVVGSAVVALAFAAHSAYTLFRGAHRPAAGALATAVGGWLILAPLAYDVGGVATGVVQTGGLLLAAFAGYVTLDTLLPPEAGYRARERSR